MQKTKQNKKGKQLIEYVTQLTLRFYNNFKHTHIIFVHFKKNKTASMNIWSNILQANKQTLTSDVFIDWA